MELYQKAVDLDTRTVRSITIWEWAYGERGDLDKAEQIFKKALDKDKNNADAHSAWESSTNPPSALRMPSRPTRTRSGPTKNISTPITA